MTPDNLTVWATTILGVAVLGGISIWLVALALEPVVRRFRTGA